MSYLSELPFLTQFKHTDGRLYRVIRIDPLQILVKKQDEWVPLRGSVRRFQEIYRAYLRVKK